MFSIVPSLLPPTSIGGEELEAENGNGDSCIDLMCVSLMLAGEVVTVSTCSGTRVQVSHMAIM